MANNLALGIVIGAAVSGTVGRAFQSLDQSAAHLGTSLQRVRLGRAAAEDVIRYRTQLDNLNNAQRQWGVGNTHLFGQIAETEQHLRTASAAAERYGINVGSIVSENRRLIQSEERLAGQLQRTNIHQANRSRRAELGGQIVGTAGMAMIASAPIKAAADFETTMLDVRESVKMTDAEFNTLGNSILHLSATTPVAASGIGEIVAQGGKLGIANKDLVAFTQDVVHMSVALGISGEEAGVMMAHWRNAMGLSQQQAVLLGDAVNTLGDTMNISSVDLAEVIRKEGAYALSAGFSVAQTAALSAALLNSGTPAKQTGMIFKGLTGALLAGGHATKAQAKAFEDLGLTSTDVTAKMKTDAVGALNDVLAAVAKQPKELQGGIIGNLFGPKAKEPILALLAHTESLSGALNTVGEASNYAGANQEEFKKKSESTANQLNELKGAINEVEVKLGTAMLPTLKLVVGGFSSLGSFVSSIANEFPIATQLIAGFGAGLVGLKVAILGFGFVKTIFSDIAAAQWLWNTALLGCPIVWVIGAVVAFGALAYTVYKNWEPITAWFRKIWADIGIGVQGVGAAISGAFSTMAATVRSIWEALANWISAKIAQIGAMANGLISTAQTIGNTMSSIGKFMTTPIIGKSAAVGAAMAATAAMPAQATPLPAMPAGKHPPSIMYNTNATIHVSQKAGENSEDFADRVIKKLKNQEAADKRGRLHD